MEMLTYVYVATKQIFQSVRGWDNGELPVFKYVIGVWYKPWYQIKI